jgi:hypothetical protein
MAGGLMGVSLSGLAAEALAQQDAQRFLQKAGGAEVYSEKHKNYITPELQYEESLNQPGGKRNLIIKQLLAGLGLPILGALAGNGLNGVLNQ